MVSALSVSGPRYRLDPDDAPEIAGTIEDMRHETIEEMVKKAITESRSVHKQMVLKAVCIDDRGALAEIKTDVAPGAVLDALDAEKE